MTDPLDPKGFRKALGKITPQKKTPRLDGKKRTTVKLNAKSWDVLEQLAKYEGTTSSSLLDLFLELGLAMYANRELESMLNTRRVASNSPRYHYLIEAGVSPATLVTLAERLDLPQLLSLR